MTKNLRQAKKFNFALWIFVLPVASVWAVSWVRLGPSVRLLNPGWEEPLRQACANKPKLCRSIELTNRQGWFNIEHVVQIQSPAGHGDAALALLSDQLSTEQRAFVTMRVVQSPLIKEASHGKGAAAKLNL